MVRLVPGLVVCGLLLLAPRADAQVPPGVCRIVDVDFTPTDNLQIVIWAETLAGEFIDTAYITRLTGSYGLGNRPGMMTFNSARTWPYGRRTTTFPIWAGRHGLEWPLVVFQDGNDSNLSHALTQSSVEPFFCRPIKESESLWDATSCATQVYTDKGTFAASQTSPYPPRRDVGFVAGRDSASVGEMSGMNPFDAISRATPLGGQRYTVTWLVPPNVPNGDYVTFIEVSKENDPNEFYDFPEPVGIPWQEYGTPYRGQPSVVYRVPFTVVSAGDMSVSEKTYTSEYFGYGDPGGENAEQAIDSEVRPPDSTISTAAGTGAGRLMLTADDGRTFRVRVTARSEFDPNPPGGAGQVEVVETAADSATVQFIAPGDDDQTGKVGGYEVRFLAGTEITEDNFHTGTIAPVQIEPAEAGNVHTFKLPNLLPSTYYSVGIRAYDDCLNKGPVIAASITTPRSDTGEVSYCFVATAAYGSPLAEQVQTLRNFRDAILKKSAAGNLFIAIYYTFGPLFARVIAESDELRGMARGFLQPLVEDSTR